MFALFRRPSILALIPSMMGCHPMTPKLVPPAAASFVNKPYVLSRPCRCAWSDRLRSRTRVRVRVRLCERLRERCVRHLLLLPPNISSRCLLIRDDEVDDGIGVRFSDCWLEEEKFYFFIFSMASLPRLGRDFGRDAGPALLRLRSRSRSFMAGEGPLPKAVDGRAVRVSPLPSLPALLREMPFFRSFLNSRYIFAPCESGNGEDAGSGTSAPFWRSTSATGKGFRGIGLDGLGGVVAES